MKRRVKHILIWAGITLTLLAGAVFLFFNLPYTPGNHPVIFGVTFTPSYARYLGLDWKKNYTDILDDLGVRRFRLSAFWNEVEPQKNSYQFDDMDYQINEADKRGAKAILAVGRKLPRWPECHDPAWVKGLSKKDLETELLKYVKTTVERYKNSPVVEEWQIENEPFFSFGMCDNDLGVDTLKKEIDLVKSLDTRPVVITDSGEWSSWVSAAKQADILGISMYRESWSNWFGRIYFPIGPGYYIGKASLISRYQKRIFISELQVEPWAPKALDAMTVDQMRVSMPVSKMQSNIQFARNVGFDEAYLWGVEWWYFMKQHGDDSYWNEGRKLY